MHDFPADFLTSSNAYRQWLSRYLSIDHWKDREKKLKENTPFEFLRGTFYRWSELWPYACPKSLQEAPEVLGIGDLHVENFGTWRDVEGRLVWGVNDLDECCCLPYTNDLIRLATSAWMAIEDYELQPKKAKLKKKEFLKQLPELHEDSNLQHKVREQARDACRYILDGYLKASQKGCQPIVLAEKNDWLREIVMNKLIGANTSNDKGAASMVDSGASKGDVIDSFDEFWDEMRYPQPGNNEDAKDEHLQSLSGGVPRSAWKALTGSLPETGLDFKIGKRLAGRGSLGRQRFTLVVENWHGGILIREAKALAPSAWNWYQPDSPARSPDEILYEQVLHHSVRSPDPSVSIHIGTQSWVVRRLAADSGKVRIKDLPRPEQWEKLWKAMGLETANVHIRLGDVSGHLASLNHNGDWLFNAAEAMRQATMKDWGSVFSPEHA